MIALIDYGAGNLQSVANALAHLEADFAITDDPDTVANSAKVIFPGVGAAASCMQALADRGLDETLRRMTRPVLGICLGMQVLTSSSGEGAREVECLGVLPGHTSRFDGNVKLPQIGWNTIEALETDPLLEDIKPGEHFYFLHSYRVHANEEHILAQTVYGAPYPSIVRRDNFWGVQFHPEKSGPAGLRLLRNFIELC
jgi:glutamine amidotransferase